MASFMEMRRYVLVKVCAIICLIVIVHGIWRFYMWETCPFSFHSSAIKICRTNMTTHRFAIWCNVGIANTCCYFQN